MTTAIKWESVEDSDDEKVSEADEPVDYGSLFMRAQQFALSTGPRPEVVKKTKEMTKRLVSAGPFISKSYIIKIYLTNIKPLIYRRLRVPGSLTLHSFHDKVIAPAMGWCRNYHAYYFKELPDQSKDSNTVGVVFGPVDSGAIDMMHRGIHGVELVDDRAYKIGEFLQKVGDKLRYNYDLGDQFRHKIVVEQVIDQPSSDEANTVEVLDGWGACPPEDGHGNHSYVDDLIQLTTGTSKKKRELLDRMSNSSNYRGEAFDPSSFSLKACQRRVMLALQSKTSANDASNLATFDVRSGRVFGGKFENTVNLGEKTTDCPVCRQPSTQKCSRCKVVYYCGREHQKEHWKEHKKTCSKEVTMEEEPQKMLPGGMSR
ncbi:hypothetical protein PROFUN_10925 [Planoprotostelium fungivorum]|uniref:MYND-type domain-containing protein n=1 Tax=Planoprotostelium fungivorum TaxID=1890364 RepID=A0A2P6NC09_9EUKA|nr:hypothetical protein PROFUN_10925 [Planoprotostelium fungivorum]